MPRRNTLRTKGANKSKSKSKSKNWVVVDDRGRERFKCASQDLADGYALACFHYEADRGRYFEVREESDAG